MERVGLTIIFVLAFLHVFAQQLDSCQYELTGQILDAETKESLPYVRVELKEVQRITLTDENGRFKFENLCEEEQVLSISCFGYCDTICEKFHEHSKSPHIFLKQQVNLLETVTIEVEKEKEAGTATVALETISKETLSNDPTQSLASALSEVDGVTFTSTGNNVQLPVIHGLYGNRVLILNNGFKHGFQNWGLDHAPEIDLSSVNSITVVKGAAGVRYGPEALGGAVVVESDHLHLKEDFHSQVGSGYQTNGRGYFVNTEVGQGLKNWSYHVGAGYTRIGDKTAPDYMLTNSGKEEKSANIGIRYQQKDWNVKLYYSIVDQNLALLRSSLSHSGTSFTKSINSDIPVFIRPFAYTINEPKQAVLHQLGKIEIDWWYSDDAKITFRYGTQLNKRNEFDVRRNIERPIIDLSLFTNDFQLEWKHPDWKKLNGLVGIQQFTQNNDNNPGTGTTPFIPNYNSLRYSGFVIESLKEGKNTFEVGVRFDYEYNNVRGRETNQDIFKDEYSFSNVTSSLGYIRQVSDNSEFRTNIGTAWRTPNMAELYSFGQHGFKTTYGLLRYYINQDDDIRTNKVALLEESEVKPEKGYKWINEFRTQNKANKLVVTGYGHYIQNFTFDRPFAVLGTIRGPMPAFIMDQANAVFLGTDITWNRQISKQVSGVYGFSYLWSRNVERKETLINQPPITTSYKLIWQLPAAWKFEKSELTLKTSYTFQQFQAPRTVGPEALIEGDVVITNDAEIFDFKEAPEGYFLLDLAWHFTLKNINGSLAIQNILNASYRDYLNEMRYFADEPGRNFLFTINYMFNAKSNKNEKD